MIHYDLKAIISKLSVVVIALLSLTIGGTITSHTNVSAHSVRSVKQGRSVHLNKIRRHHTKGVQVERIKRFRKTKSQMTKRNRTMKRRQNRRAPQKSQRPLRVEHRYTSSDPISIGPKSSKKK